MDRQLLDLYSDYLISSFGQATATGLARLLDGVVSHDQVTRFLAKSDYTSRELWQLIKPKVRQIESAEEGIIIFDDTIIEKPHTDENEIVCWHLGDGRSPYHSKGRNVKGVAILNCLYQAGGHTLPIAFEIVRKNILYIDEKTQTLRRKSEVTKNELLKRMLKHCRQNQLKYKYVLTDSWYCSQDNLEAIKLTYKKDFICAIQSNRLVALSLAEKKKGIYDRIESLHLEEGVVYRLDLKGLPFEVLVVRQLFKNEDGSGGELGDGTSPYLVTSDLTLSYDAITAIYQRRWKDSRWNIGKEYHKSIKQNTAAGRSPTRTVRTQSNHFFLAIYAFFKLECLSLAEGVNQFAFVARLWLPAMKASFKELRARQQLVAA